VKMATENNVLVIADPNLKGKFYQLPNAAVEGGRVSQQLQSGGFSVQSDIGGSSDSILRKMYVRPYKVLHIAAHGVFEFGDSKATGVVIGPESFLTPAHINQMSETPELVFINCCYLGKTDLQAEHFAQNRYRLAANIGTQLINDGVKAVIVAGWPVGDRAALLFASNFYEGMLRGELFGEAVLKARRQVYERFGSDDNTWGAYQCYGDPSYVLKSKKISGLATEDTEFETEEVLVMELTNLLNDLDLAQGTEQKLSRIAAIESSLSASQRSSGRVIELLAQVYVALGNLKKAIEHYESLKSFSNAKYSLRSLEQLCNLKVKYSMQKWRSNPSDLSETQRVINDAIVELNRLQAISPTSERFNLLASCYKRLAMIEQAPDLKKENYQKTAQYYREASGLIPSHEMFYPLANASLIDFVLEGSTQTKKKKGTLSDSTNTLVKEYERIRKKATNKDDYWSQVALCELPLYLWLIEGREANTQRLLALAESIKKHSGHLSNWAAIAEQLYFLEDLFGLLENSKEKEKKLAMIRQVRERVG
jgi:tetratricopeptide (TPR) repeat protein